MADPSLFRFTYAGTPYAGGPTLATRSIATMRAGGFPLSIPNYWPLTTVGRPSQPINANDIWPPYATLVSNDVNQTIKSNFVYGNLPSTLSLTDVLF